MTGAGYLPTYPDGKCSPLLLPPRSRPADIECSEDHLPDLGFIFPERLHITVGRSFQAREFLSDTQEILFLRKSCKEQSSVKDAELDVVSDDICDVTKERRNLLFLVVLKQRFQMCQFFLSAV